MKKLSFKNAKKMLSRKEMKAINGGGYGSVGSPCSVYSPDSHLTYTGTCQSITGNNITTYYCATALGYYEVGNSSGMSHCTP